MPGDTMVFRGTVAAMGTDDAGTSWVDLDVDLTVDDELATACSARVALPADADDHPWRRRGDTGPPRPSPTHRLTRPPDRPPRPEGPTMDLELTPEQQMLRDAVRDLCAKYGDPDRLRELEDDPIGFDRDVWRELAAMDLIGLTLPAEHGGSGMTRARVDGRASRSWGARSSRPRCWSAR